MTAPSDEEIIQAVCDLEDQWQKLLGASDATAAQDLLDFAGQNKESARQAANLLLDLFSQHSALTVLHERIQYESATKGVRLYNPPPGKSGPVAVAGIIYHCPIHGCSVKWQPQVAGQTVPYCSLHPERRLVSK